MEGGLLDRRLGLEWIGGWIGRRMEGSFVNVVMMPMVSMDRCVVSTTAVREAECNSMKSNLFRT